MVPRSERMRRALYRECKRTAMVFFPYILILNDNVNVNRLKMCKARKFIRFSKYLLAGATVFCVSWIVSVNEWYTGVRWKSPRAEPLHYSTMRTIVSYSEQAKAAMEKPSPVTCNRLPAYLDVPTINRTWVHNTENESWQKVEGTSISLYAAYYDSRTAQPYIRIIAMHHGHNQSKKEPLYCQTRPKYPNEGSVEVVAAKLIDMWWHEWDSTFVNLETPVLLSCPLTDALTVPSVVSVVKEPCDDPTNGFQMTPPKRNKQYNRKFTICVKDMFFKNDISYNLIEWIEANKLLGAHMIDMYIDSINSATQSILELYRSKGYIRLFQVPLKNKPERTLWQRRRDHVVTYNDCLYRNIDESEFIVPLDVDEILLPKRSYTWYALLKRLTPMGWNSSTYSAILVTNVFFFDFMQNRGYENNKKNRNKSKMYIKRDDVRLSDLELNKESRNLGHTVDNKHKEEDATFDCGDKLPVPKVARHIISSGVVSPVGEFSKSIMVTKRVLTAFNHYPLADFGSDGLFTIWSAPVEEVQLNHYKESCNTTLVNDCAGYEAAGRVDRSALYLRRRLARNLYKMWCKNNHIK